MSSDVRFNWAVVRRDPRLTRMRRIRQVMTALLALSALVAGVLVGRTLLFRSRQPPVTPAQDLKVNGAAVAAHLAQALRFRTVSTGMGHPDFAPLHHFLAQTYPKTHRVLQREILPGGSLLYTWKGKNHSLPPVLLLAHQDVVPVESETVWKHPPFAGDIAGGFVWGRGALDDKIGIVGILEAVEGLLRRGFRPDRSVYLAFGHDEEVSGHDGAKVMAQLLEKRGVHPEFLLDEGGAITNGIVKGLSGPAAIIGVAEKGYVSLELRVRGAGGHSSMPPPETAIGLLSSAVVRLESDPFPARITGVSRDMLDYLGPEMALPKRMALANLWLFGGVVRSQLLGVPATAAGLRTTTAPTLLSAGVKDNVLAQEARAVVNFRIVPGETVASVTERVRRTVGDKRVVVTALRGSGENPSPVSPIDSAAFRTLQRTVREVLPQTIVAPGLVLGATDSRHYTRLSPAAFRFSPFVVTAQDLTGIHGIDERISVQNCELAVRFYMQLLRNFHREGPAKE